MLNQDVGIVKAKQLPEIVARLGFEDIERWEDFEFESELIGESLSFEGDQFDIEWFNIRADSGQGWCDGTVEARLYKTTVVASIIRLVQFVVARMGGCD